MKEIPALLLEENGVAARRRLEAILEHQPERTEEAAAIAAQLISTAYEQFHLKGVHDFHADMALSLPAVVTERIEQALGDKIKRTELWSHRLRGVTHERLVRECRDAIVAGDLKRAARRVLALFARARDEAEIDDFALYVARGMVELTHDHERALTVIGYAMKAGAEAGAAAALLADRFSHLAKEFKSVQFSQGDQAWQRQLTEAVLSLRAWLPGPMEAGEPDPAQVDKFYHELHAILRAGLIHKDRDDFIDALQVVMEYGPTDPPTVKNVASVEERMFLKLGPRAKLAAVRALARLGEIPALRRAVLSLTRDAEKEDRLRLLAAIMGALRHPEFYPYLKQELAQCKIGKVESERREEIIVEALGRISNPEAVELLTDRLAIAVKNRREPTYERRAYVLLTALGRIGRAKGLEPARRNQFVKKIIELVHGAERRLTFRAADALFSVRLGELSPELKDWAAEQTIEAMWGQPPQGAAATPGVNGWREPMVQILRRLGPDCLSAVMQAASKYVTHYGGASGALANALAEIGDARALPLLEDMLRCALLHQEDPGKSQRFEETVVDAASGEIRPLDRDDLVHTLLYTVYKIGGEKGQALVLDYADQIQAGRLESPGKETLAFLTDIKMRHGKIGQVMHYERPADMEMDHKALKNALADARGGMLTKKSTRIAAMAALGQARRAEGTLVLLEGLGDKDAMIASAAHTALAQFMRPLPKETDFSEFFGALLEKPGMLKGRLLERLLEFIRKEVPKNPPYDRLYERQVEIAIDDGALGHQLRAAAARPSPPGRQAEDGAGEGGSKTAGAENPDGAAGGGLTDLDKRRAYMQARREWIAGGKLGTPPKPPPGI